MKRIKATILGVKTLPDGTGNLTCMWQNKVFELRVSDWQAEAASEQGWIECLIPEEIFTGKQRVKAAEPRRRELGYKALYERSNN